MEESETPRKKRRRLRLELLLSEVGGAAQVAREIGTPKSYLSAVINKSRGLGDALAAKLEATYAKPEGWFDLAIAGDDGQASVAVESLSHAIVTSTAVHVPLLANAGSMGAGSEALNGDVIVGTIALSPEWIEKRIHPSTHQALRFIHAYGDSMSPTFSNGDVLLVDTGARDPAVDGVYVLEAHGRVFIKRVRQRLDGVYEVSSDNPTVKTVDVLNGDHQVDVLGRVLFVWRGNTL